MQNENRPHILITNDDGATAPGLLALCDALQTVGRLTVIAPDRNWSASGHSKTMHKPLRADRGTLQNGLPALITTGAPADAIALGLMGLADGPVDLVITGINRGANLGHDVTYSGTVTAAMEGAIGGVPSMAVSLKTRAPDADYTVAARFATHLAQEILDHDLPTGVVLNVNVPAQPIRVLRGVKITRMGLRIYHDELVRRLDPSGRPYFWIGGQPPTGLAEKGTDIWAVEHDYISITPIQLDFTAYPLIEEIATWTLEDDEISNGRSAPRD
jgi:5'-nucleotidase